jgi:GNAT superfamily N-acetyltransferase
VSAEQLSDGSRIEIRPLTGADKTGLAAGFERLSPLSRYRRFFTVTPELTAKQLAYLTEIDHHDHEALVAIEPATNHGLGVARYVRSPEHPAEAEVAVAVADDWQRRGLGTLLLRHLAARAHEEGIASFTGLLLRDNAPMRHVLEALGHVVVRDASSDTLEVSLRIPDDPLGEGRGRLARWLRAGALGHIATRLHAPRADDGEEA